ncbi:MAG: glycosyltransferase family 9 protein [Dysgonomonas sp.]
MHFKGKVNHARRFFMHFLTKGIGQEDDIIDINNFNINNVLICRPNSRLGNQLLTTPIIQEISSDFPNCKIDLFVRGGAAFPIFKNNQNIDQIIKLPQKPFSDIIQYLSVWYSLRRKNYDLVINIDNGSSSGKLATKLARSKRKIFGVMDDNFLAAHSDYMHMAKAPIYNLRKSFGVDFKMNIAIPTLDIKLDPDEKKRGGELLFNIVKNDKATICIYTYATGVKCYSVEWWTRLYGLLKEKYEDRYNIIEILPKENISQINFKAPSFYSMDLREIAALIANATLFIGADSGIMHLASSSGALTIGLFSVNNMDRYQPYGKRNLGINTNDKNFEDILHIIDISLTS